MKPSESETITKLRYCECECDSTPGLVPRLFATISAPKTRQANLASGRFQSKVNKREKSKTSEIR